MNLQLNRAPKRRGFGNPFSLFPTGTFAYDANDSLNQVFLVIGESLQQDQKVLDVMLLFNDRVPIRTTVLQANSLIQLVKIEQGDVFITANAD